MAYTLTYSIGTITVVDSTLNTQTSLSLPGRNYAGYGQPVDQNQISILENFASFLPMYLRPLRTFVIRYTNPIQSSGSSSIN